jgi:hypothetical protein
VIQRGQKHPSAQVTCPAEQDYGKWLDLDIRSQVFAGLQEPARCRKGVLKSLIHSKLPHKKGLKRKKSHIDEIYLLFGYQAALLLFPNGSYWVYTEICIIKL